MPFEVRELRRLLRKHAWDTRVEVHAQEAEKRERWGMILCDVAYTRQDTLADGLRSSGG
jgi:hypothetical protein